MMKKRSANNINGKDQPLRLERVIGMTSMHSTGIAANSKGDLFYAAGNIVVRYNLEDNRQKWFYQSSNRPITCMAVSDDNRYLAIGERGHQPAVVVWDAERKEKVATLHAHKYGIGCVAFSPNGQYLVTVGFKHDRQLIVWEWMDLKIVNVLKLTKKVNSIHFQNEGKYFITCGDRHLKWWDMHREDEYDSIDVIGKVAYITEEHATAVFMDVCCGTGLFDKYSYCITSSGALCVFINESRMMEKWLQLDTPSAYCVSFVTFVEDASTEDKCYLFLGCANGIVQVLSPSTLTQIAVLPLPCPLQGEDDPSSRYPACYGIKMLPLGASSAFRMATIYSDHSLFIWDISDVYNITRMRSFISHRGCIWDIQFLEQYGDSSSLNASHEYSSSSTTLPRGTFITSSSDNTVRFWSTDMHAQKKSKWRSLYSRELLHTIEVTPSDSSLNPSDSPVSKNSAIDSLSPDQSSSASASILSAGSHSLPSNARSLDLSTGIIDNEMPDKSHNTNAPRALALNAYDNHLAVGDRCGKIRIYNLKDMSEISVIQAHSAEILTLSYSQPMRQTDDGIWVVDVDAVMSESDSSSNKPLVLLASAGRDRLIHIFDASSNYSPVKTLDNHSSSVTIVKFTLDGQKILSCGGDRTLVFSSVNGHDISRIRSIQTPHGTINGLALETTNKFVLTSGQDRKMNIWNASTGKHMRVYKNDNIVGELYRCDIDPSGTYICACGFDKMIHVLDFFSGEVIFQVAAHSELITGVKFSPDGRYIVSIGGDGCIMQWKLGDLLVRSMQDRLMELYSKAQRKVSKAILRQSLANPDVMKRGYENPISREDLNSDGSSSSSVSGSQGNNKWVARANADGHGYELFGQKLSPDNKHKLTLEMTEGLQATNNIRGDDGHIISLQPGNVLNATDLASTFEALDSVILSTLSDDKEDEESMLFEALEPQVELDNINLDFDSDRLNDAGSKLDILEKSAQNLEDWLEKMIRNEGTLDEVVSTSLPGGNQSKNSSPKNYEMAEKIESSKDKGGKDALNKSLSSSFFQNLKSVGRGIEPTDKVPPIVVPNTSIPPAQSAIKVKRRETAAAVAQMKDRLRSMGILAATLAKPNSEDKKVDPLLPSPAQATSNIAPPMPPLPHLNPAKQANIRQVNPIPNPTSSDVDSSRQSISMIRASQSSIHSLDLSPRQAGTDALGLKSVADAAELCRQSLRELEIAKEKALKNLQEFVSLTQDTGASADNVNETETSNFRMDDTSNILSSRASISRETEQLFKEFRRSIDSMSMALSQSHSMIPFETSPTSPSRFGYLNETDAAASANVSGILEKYSDRLLELVSSKIADKLI